MLPYGLADYCDRRNPAKHRISMSRTLSISEIQTSQYYYYSKWLLFFVLWQIHYRTSNMKGTEMIELKHFNTGKPFFMGPSDRGHLSSG